MTPGEIVIVAFNGFLATGLGTLFWRRMERLEDRMDAGFAQVDARFAQVDARFAQVDVRFAQVDARFAQVDQRLDHLRTDLTQIALAVGAGRPRATER